MFDSKPYRLVCNKFSELTADKPTLAKRKVLAGIVMTNEKDPEDMKVCPLWVLFGVHYDCEFVTLACSVVYLMNYHLDQLLCSN